MTDRNEVANHEKLIEEAHTPADDEREALARRAIRAADEADECGDPVIEAWSDDLRTLAAGFHRAEVPEPSAEQIAVCRDLADRAHKALRLPRGRLETTKKLARLTLPLSVALDHFLASAEPQGEPSDAQVGAALESYWGYPDGYSRGQFEKMRAALRAAWEVR